MNEKVKLPKPCKLVRDYYDGIKKRFPQIKLIQLGLDLSCPNSLLWKWFNWWKLQEMGPGTELDQCRPITWMELSITHFILQTRPIQIPIPVSWQLKLVAQNCPRDTFGSGCKGSPLASRARSERGLFRAAVNRVRRRVWRQWVFLHPTTVKCIPLTS